MLLFSSLLFSKHGMHKLQMCCGRCKHFRELLLHQSILPAARVHAASKKCVTRSVNVEPSQTCILALCWYRPYTSVVAVVRCDASRRVKTPIAVKA